MSKKVRIVKRIHSDKSIEYVIQQKHFLFFWWWVDAWMNDDVSTEDSFDTLEEAENNLCYFNGSKMVEEVIKNVKN